MKIKEMTVDELALLAATRGALGAGVALLIAGRLSETQRRAAGWALVLVGIVTTFPLAAAIFSRD